MSRSLLTLLAFGMLLVASYANVHAGPPPAMPVPSKPADSTNKPAANPNIVLIMADDLGYGSIGCYGNTQVATPNLDSLAARGIRLTNFHSNGALCTPTRAALLTGRYQQRCLHVADALLSPVFVEQRQQNPGQRWAWGLSDSEVTLPQLLGQAGYRTALVGKWHLGYDVSFHPMSFGFDEFRGFMGGNVDYHTHVAGYGLKQLDWWHDRTIENEAGYTTDLLTRYACEFIRQHSQQPFFLYLAHATPHDPLQGRDRAAKRSPAETYKQMIEILDESVGAVVEQIRSQQLESNTLIIFCSDNGPAAPRGFAASPSLRGNKGTLLEGGHRVPLIAVWPGFIPAGLTSDAATMSMDLLPTFTKLAGVSLPAERVIDGRDIMPVLKGMPVTADRDLHWQSLEAWAVSRGPWKLMGEGDRAVSLFDLRTDLKESLNLLDREPARVAELMKSHEQWHSAVASGAVVERPAATLPAGAD